MAYYTEAALREVARGSGALTASAAESLLRKSAQSTGTFDIFLSHSVRDAQVILGLKTLLESAGQRVYLDWVDDPQLSRSDVSAGTADVLRGRMKTSRSLMYATSRAASTSRWMPWELGYFDGWKGSSHISIVPIESYSQAGFAGQEYLGLYPVVENLPTRAGGEMPFVTRASGMEYKSLNEFVAGNGAFHRL